MAYEIAIKNLFAQAKHINEKEIPYMTTNKQLGHL